MSWAQRRQHTLWAEQQTVKVAQQTVKADPPLAADQEPRPEERKGTYGALKASSDNRLLASLMDVDLGHALLTTHSSTKAHISQCHCPLTRCSQPVLMFNGFLIQASIGSSCMHPQIATS